MTYFLNPDAVRRPSVIQFQIEDPRLDDPVCMYFEYDRNDCRLHEGEAAKWTTRITVKYEFWRELQGKYGRQVTDVEGTLQQGEYPRAG